MEQLISVLPAILEAAGESSELAEAACKASWKHAVGEALTDHAVPVRLRQKILTVAVADTVWAQQLQPMLGQLLFRLNSILGQPLVTRIELEVDPSTVAKSRAGREKPKPGTEKDNSVPFELLSAAAGIEDPDLRRAFLGAAASCLKRVERSQI